MYECLNLSPSRQQFISENCHRICVNLRLSLQSWQKKQWLNGWKLICSFSLWGVSFWGGCSACCAILCASANEKYNSKAEKKWWFGLFVWLGWDFVCVCVCLLLVQFGQMLILWLDNNAHLSKTHFLQWSTPLDVDDIWYSFYSELSYR